MPTPNKGHIQDAVEVPLPALTGGEGKHSRPGGTGAARQKLARKGPGPFAHKAVRIVFVLVMVIAYAAIAVLVAWAESKSGAYPDGSDTMFYVYRGDFLYRSIAESGNWYPLLDPQWYNGVETFRYWSPLSSIMLAGCQCLTGGDPLRGYLVFVGLLCFFTMLVWLVIGCTHKRPVLGAVMGPLWFFTSNNLFLLFAEGVIARSIAVMMLPVFLIQLHDWLKDQHWASLLKMILSFAFLVMCHSGWAGMVAITTLVFLLIYALCNRRRERGSCLAAATTMVLGYAICGIWLFVSLRGGITGIDSSSIMVTSFQNLNATLNPFYGWQDGSRWTDAALGYRTYFGIVAFLLCIFGVLFSRRRTVPAFVVAILICLATSTAAYPFIKLLPGGQILWMLRFVSIALGFVMVAFFNWKSLKPAFVVAICVLLAVDALPGLKMITVRWNDVTPEERYASVEQTTLLGEAKQVTNQRLAVIEPKAPVADGIYIAAGYGDDAVPIMFGQGVQSAADYRNIVQCNEAAEKGDYLYLFDRCLELGNDTVLVRVHDILNGAEDISDLDAAAVRLGYELTDQNQDFRLYHLSQNPGTFGVSSTYRCIGIGKSAPVISLMFPTVKETVSTNLNDYTYDELSQYDEIFLSGFTYTNRDEAEELVTRLSENGTRVIIMADGIPEETHTGSKTFLGIDCETIDFYNGFPELDTIDGKLACDLFPAEYADWKTVYVNGLDDVWGTIHEDGRDLDFYGTVKNDNIMVIGLNLTFYFSLTRDNGVGVLLSHALDLSSDELPQRAVVPLEVEYGKRAITITSDLDGVDTTLAYHDIFSSDQEIWDDNHLLYVNAGTTVVNMRYPYLLEGMAVTLLGVGLSIFLLAEMRKRERKKRGNRARSSEAGGSIPASGPLETEPAKMAE